MATEEQRREIVTAVRAARAARDDGRDARPLFAAAEALMYKYGAGNEPPPDDDASSLTREEKARLRDLMIRAAEVNDTDGLEQLRALAGDPGRLRDLLAQFPENAPDA